MNDGAFSLKEKHPYFAQVQVGMAILNLECCYFAIFCSFDKSMAVLPIKLDAYYAKQLLSKVKIKFYNYMLHNICQFT